MYPVIKVPASGKPVWYGGARVMCFVYSKNDGNFILEGFSNEVEKYLKENYKHYFYYLSMWSHGQSRGYWRFWKDNDVSIFTPSKSRKDWKYLIVKYGKQSDYHARQHEVEISLKRLPKRWIPEFNKL